MRVTVRSLRRGLLVLGLVCTATESLARRAGITESACSGCHGSNQAELEVLFEPPVTEAGQETTITVKVKGSTLQVAGIAVSLPEGGQYTIAQDEPLAVSGVWLVHNQPKPAIDGEVVFRFGWRTPSEVGSGAYTVAVLAANDNRVQTGDSTASTSGRLGYGCQAVTLYRDNDGDGVGVTSQFLTDCVGLSGFVAASGDCDDNDKTKFPGAPESCNELDDDCDDVIDEEVVDQTYYLDQDADGYGYSEESLVACTAVAGYVTNALDCNWTSPAIHPDAVEICDLVDNDCDAEVDEGFEVYCGSGECRRRAANCLITCIEGEPSTELCNGKDDDCDEQVDEGCDGSVPDPATTPQPTGDPAPTSSPTMADPATSTPPTANTDTDAASATAPPHNSSNAVDPSSESSQPNEPSVLDASVLDASAAPATPDEADNTEADPTSEDTAGSPAAAGCALSHPARRSATALGELTLALLGLALAHARRTYRGKRPNLALNRTTRATR